MNDQLSSNNENNATGKIPDWVQEKPGMPNWQHKISKTDNFTLLAPTQVFLTAGGEIDKDNAAGLYLDLMLNSDLVSRAVLTGHGRFSASVASTLWLEAGTYSLQAIWRSDRAIQTIYQHFLGRPDVDQSQYAKYTLSLKSNGAALMAKLSFPRKTTVATSAVYEAVLLGSGSDMTLYLSGRRLPANGLESEGPGYKKNTNMLDNIPLSHNFTVPASAGQNINFVQIEASMSSNQAMSKNSTLIIHVG